MQADSLAALVRAVARLQADSEPDAELLDALVRLIAPPPRIVAARPRRDAALPGPKEPRPTALERPDNDLVEPRAPELHRDAATTTGSRSHRPDGRLVSRPSALNQVAERADLAEPRRDRAGITRPGELRRLDAAVTAAPLESLFAPGRVRAIVRELATLSADSGPLDIDAALRRVARAEPIERLPRRRISALAHSVHLLFDVGPAMLPFATDQQQFAATAARLLGRDRVRIADFVLNPLQGVRVQRQVRWEAMRWPGRRSAVMVVSDLGIGSRATDARLQADGWRRFVAETQRRGLRSVVLIPYARARWPEVAAHFGTALTWDLDTGVQALRRIARRRGWG